MNGFQKLISLALSVAICLSPQMLASAKTIGWGIPRAANEEQPWPGQEFDEIIRANDAYYIGSPDEKVVYLTFDAGFENGNMPAILDALKNEGAPALFFLTGHFMETHPELVKRMVDEGHLVGNHTYHHPDLTKVSREKFNQELRLMEEKYKEITGLEMVRYLRPPEGHFNQQMLDWAKEEGYYTILWSLAYVDWKTDQQKGERHALDQVMGRIHPGAIILLHSTSSDNGKAMDDILKAIREKGYACKSMQYLMSQELPEPFE
ncbi:MAG: polysaccharide deacetylase family protein [Turicibacter sp.]|nr:polysaccharide deacetylase family protein [Turicibacter sp.]